MSEEIFVVVAERDTYETKKESRPIVFETFADSATLEEAKRRQSLVGDRYGKTRLAKLQFVNENGEPEDE